MKILIKTFANRLVLPVALGLALLVQGCSPSKTDVAVVPQIATSNFIVPINPTTGATLFQVLAARQPTDFVFSQAITASSVTDSAGNARPLQITTGLSTWTFSAPANASPTFSTKVQNANGSISNFSGILSFGSCIFTITSASAERATLDGLRVGDVIKVEECSVRLNTAGQRVGVITSGEANLILLNSTGQGSRRGDLVIDAAGNVSFDGYFRIPYGSVTLSNPTGGS